MQKHLARFSCFIEDPKLNNTVLSNDDFLVSDAVSLQYAGHNLSRDAILKAALKLTPLTHDEQQVIQWMKKFKDIQMLIGFVAGDEKTSSHEMLHVSFFTNHKYNERIHGIWNMVKVKHIKWALEFQLYLESKYHPDVWVDEFQAIILNGEYECIPQIYALLKTAADATHRKCFDGDYKIIIDV